jgi:hypothetical protein
LRIFPCRDEVHPGNLNVQIKIKNMGGRDDVSLKNIDLRLLECADVLLRECNVSVAAERLQMSQGNMSPSLARLRELLGDPLLDPA